MVLAILGLAGVAFCIGVVIWMAVSKWKETRVRRKADEYYTRMFGRWGA